MRGPLLLRTRTTDFDVFREIFVRGDYASVFDVVDRPPDLIVDLGANIGLAARWFLARWPDARILAVEPERHNSEVLRANLKLGRASATVHQVCVGGWERTATLTTSQGEYAFRVSVDDEWSGIEVPVLPLGKILEDAGVDGRIDLLKCDIEGMEKELFDSCDDWIDRVRNIVVECHDEYTSAELVRVLEGKGVRFQCATLLASPASSFEVAVLVRVE